MVYMRCKDREFWAINETLWGFGGGCKGRLLMLSKRAATWARMHGEQRVLERPEQPKQRDSQTNRSTQTKEPTNRQSSVVMHYDIATDEYHHYHVAISEAANEIIRKECTLPEDNPFATVENIQNTALLLFAGYIDGATSMSASGGGGCSDMSGWGRDKDEDDLQWARRCASIANNMCKRRRRTAQIMTSKNQTTMTIRKGKSDSPDIDDPMQDINQESQLSQEESRLEEKIAALKEATAALNAAADRADIIIKGINKAINHLQTAELGATIRPDTL